VGAGLLAFLVMPLALTGSIASLAGAMIGLSAPANILQTALGIIVILSTQRPDKESVPPAVTGLIIARFCLMVPGQVENDMVLGTSSYKNGYKAISFRPKVDAGLGWLKGSEDGVPQITRTYYLDLPASERITSRARDMRDRAGVLTGYALGEADDAAPRDVLADVLAVLGDDAGLHWGELADRLANRWPDRWSDISAESLSAQLRALGVPSVDVRMGGITGLETLRRLRQTPGSAPGTSAGAERPFRQPPRTGR